MQLCFQSRWGMIHDARCDWHQASHHLKNRPQRTRYSDGCHSRWQSAENTLLQMGPNIVHNPLAVPSSSLLFRHPVMFLLCALQDGPSPILILRISIWISLIRLYIYFITRNNEYQGLRYVPFGDFWVFLINITHTQLGGFKMMVVLCLCSVSEGHWSQTLNTLSTAAAGQPSWCSTWHKVNVSYADKFIERACKCRGSSCECTDASCGCPVYATWRQYVSRKLVSEDYMTWPCLEVGLHFYAFDCSPRNAYPQFEDVLWVGFFSFLVISTRV